MTADDSFDLQRFVTAQNPVFDRVLIELRQGHKQSHWMWFVFPQLQGLGRSVMAARYAIPSLRYAKAYIRHPVLGPRLRQCTRLVIAVEGRSIHQIFGSPDDLKFHSSMTLFAHATEDKELFTEALKKYFDARFDAATLERLPIGGP